MNEQQNLSPKVDFLRDSKAADAHQEAMMNPAFRKACEVAMLEMIYRLTTDKNPAQHSLVGLQIAGARFFVKELLNLGQPLARETRNEGLAENLIPT